MAHHANMSAYGRLSDRLNLFPQGAPPGELLFSILKILFSEEEARLVSLLPIKPFTAETAARAWKMELPAARRVLEELAGRALLLDMDGTYTLPPPMAGFFEFSMMRIRDDIDQKALGELFFQYLNVEEDFVKNLFTEGETQLGRVFVNEPVLSNENALRVLDYERASRVIQTATHIGVGVCYCRHKMQHVGRECGAPMEICMTFNTSAASLTKHGHARAVTVSECMKLLEKAYDHNLVQFGDNVRSGVNFICNCCGCCCEAMIAARRFALLNPVHTTNFIPRIDEAKCTGCGKCADACPVEAMTLVSSNDPRKPKRRKAALNAEICLGCGVCVRACAAGALRLDSREERVITPVNSIHRVVLMAIERGKLQNLIFDNQALVSHRAMAAILGAILKLPPVKRIMASRQMKSKYLEKLLLDYKP
ncbi:MAG TPA: 4Fe-4S dicluster domain-containing protein [Spirochaetota bacterium]|nr:4Fe-4S dicluster domain-containing protein [Spirochaetota bacterium]